MLIPGADDDRRRNTVFEKRVAEVRPRRVDLRDQHERAPVPEAFQHAVSRVEHHRTVVDEKQWLRGCSAHERSVGAP